jgi:hypothetical protein
MELDINTPSLAFQAFGSEMFKKREIITAPNMPINGSLFGYLLS